VKPITSAPDRCWSTNALVNTDWSLRQIIVKAQDAGVRRAAARATNRASLALTFNRAIARNLLRHNPREVQLRGMGRRRKRRGKSDCKEDDLGWI